jgi:DNA-binding transcriptional MerR regulator
MVRPFGEVRMSKLYTVKGLARLSGVSVRTLHHYDQIGLLKPASVGANGYRYYGREELLRLQQILFHRELEFPLEAIAEILTRPDFDRLAALRGHRAKLAAQAQRYRRLVKTLDRTLAALEGAQDMDDDTMYQGFSPERQAEFEAWLVQRYGDGIHASIDQTKATMNSWSAQQRQAFSAEFETMEREIAKALAEGVPADSEALRPVLRRHHAWVAHGWGSRPNAAAYEGLAGLYEQHPDFRTRYESVRPGLTEYLAEAMRRFAKSELV